MADPENTTNGEKEVSESAEDLEGSLSLDDLDSVIAQEDPDFAAGLAAIGPDDPNHVLYEEGLELEYRPEDEAKLWKESKGWRSKVIKVFPFLPRIAYFIKMKRTMARLTWQKWKIQARQNIRSAPKKILAALKNLGAFLRDWLNSGLNTFKDYSLIKKLLFIGLILVTGVSVFLVYKIGTKGLLPADENLFIGSMTEWAQGKYLHEPSAQQESFYESTRTSQNILLLKKLVANLKRSANSGENPMGAFEFYVEGTVSEVVIEIKDREPEIEDLFLRTIEETTFDQVSSGEGKRALCDRLRKEVNKILTTGFVRRIFIKTAIVKP